MFLMQVNYINNKNMNIQNCNNFNNPLGVQKLIGQKTKKVFKH